MVGTDAARAVLVPFHRNGLGMGIAYVTSGHAGRVPLSVNPGGGWMILTGGGPLESWRPH